MSQILLSDFIGYSIKKEENFVGINERVVEPKPGNERMMAKEKLKRK